MTADRMVRTIGPAVPGDVAALQAIRRTAIEAIDERRVDARRRAAWLALDDGGLLRAAASGDGVLVARDGSSTAGYAWIAMGERPHLFALYVHPRLAGRHLGAALLAAAERHVLGRGGRQLFVAASPNAVGFYLRYGYLAQEAFALHCRDAAGSLALRMRKMSKALDAGQVEPGLPEAGTAPLGTTRDVQGPAEKQEGHPEVA